MTGSNIFTDPADPAPSVPARRSLRRRLSAGVAAATLLSSGLAAAPAFAAPGSLDATFGSSGIALTDFASGTDQGTAMAIQPDGKIVVVGLTDVDLTPPTGNNPVGPVNFDFGMVRYNTDGSRDTSFGTSGRVVTPFGSESDTAFAVAIQPDGKIVAGGSTITNAQASDAQFAVARYLSDGSLDPNFGSSGKVMTDISSGVDGINALTLQSDGKIVAAGVSNCQATAPTCTNADSALVRYNTNGSLDASFGTGGKVTTNMGGGDQINGVAIQSDGKIVAAGLAIGDGVDFAATRYNTNGSLDSTFGGGIVRTAVTAGQTDFANELAIQSDGKIVAGGATNKGNGGDDEFALVRYTTNGSLDTSFGTGGKVVTDVGPKADGINGVALLSDGRIVAAGRSLSSQNPFPSQIAVARYLSDGTLDASFSSDGLVTTAIAASNDEAAAVAVQPDGKVVVAGYSATGQTVEDTTFAVVRYEGGGTPQTPPGGGGGTQAGGGYWLTASDGGIFAFGDAKFQGSTGNLKLAKPIVGMAPTSSGNGYWLVASDGGIFAYGDALFYGSTGNVKLAQPIVAMTPTPSGKGYWLVASDGGIFAFGDAKFHGSTGNLKLAKPIVGAASTPGGNGYWLVASDGGIFAFGDAKFHGSTGNLKLVRPIVGMAPTSSGDGYWLVASDGGIFAFGDAVFRGSTGDLKLAQPIVGMTATTSSMGYYMVASDGGIFAFGDAVFRGSTGNLKLNRPIIGMAAF